MSLSHEECRECGYERDVDGRCGCDDLIEEREWVLDPERVHAHVGRRHHIEIVTYTNDNVPVGNLAIECVTCGVVIADIDYQKEMK